MLAYRDWRTSNAVAFGGCCIKIGTLEFVAQIVAFGVGGSLVARGVCCSNSGVSTPYRTRVGSMLGFDVAASVYSGGCRIRSQLMRLQAKTRLCFVGVSTYPNTEPGCFSHSGRYTDTPYRSSTPLEAFMARSFLFEWDYCCQ